MAAELRAVNIDMDLAPVLDVDSNPKNPVIGDRAFSSDSVKVSEFGSAFIREMQNCGVATCAKHFPGHGDAMQDSHDDLPVIHGPRPCLLKREILPFKRAIEVDTASIMMGHLLVPGLQDSSEVRQNIPASLSNSCGELPFQLFRMRSCTL